MDYLKSLEIYKRDKKNPEKTFNIEFVKEYDISRVNIKILRNIIKPKKNDTDLFLMYTLNKPQILEIQKEAHILFDIDFENYLYMFGQYIR